MSIPNLSFYLLHLGSGYTVLNIPEIPRNVHTCVEPVGLSIFEV